MKVYLYVLWSDKDDGYYIGISNNVPRRIKQHNAGFEKSTKHRIPFKLLIAKEFDSYSEARRVEKILKKYTRAKIRKFIINVQRKLTEN